MPATAQIVVLTLFRRLLCVSRVAWRLLGQPPPPLPSSGRRLWSPQLREPHLLPCPLGKTGRGGGGVCHGVPRVGGRCGSRRGAGGRRCAGAAVARGPRGGAMGPCAGCRGAGGGGAVQVGAAVGGHGGCRPLRGGRCGGLLRGVRLAWRWDRRWWLCAPAGCAVGRAAAARRLARHGAARACGGGSARPHPPHYGVHQLLWRQQLPGTFGHQGCLLVLQGDAPHVPLKQWSKVTPPPPPPRMGTPLVGAHSRLHQDRLMPWVHTLAAPGKDVLHLAALKGPVDPPPPPRIPRTSPVRCGENRPLPWIVSIHPWSRA